MKNFFTYHFINSLSKILSLLNRRLFIELAKIVGSLINTVFPVRSGVAKKNLKIAFPQKSDIEINTIIKKTYQHYSIIIFEFLRQKFIKIKSIKINIDDITKNILSSNKGIILMTAHFGNWELIIPTLGLYKKATIVVKEQRNLGGDKFVCEVREGNNISLLKTNKSKRGMIAALNKGEVLGLASDQNAGHKGTEILFFDHKASVPKGAAYFNYKTKCPIVVGFCILNQDYSYDFKLRYLDIESSNDNIDDLFKTVGQKFSDILEQEILKCPEQYFWFHRKWDRSIYN